MGEIDCDDKNKVISNNYYYSTLAPVVAKSDGSPNMVTATIGTLNSLPRLVLIGPDKEIIVHTITNINEVTTAIENAGIQKQDCENLTQITDTVNPTVNMVDQGGWWAAVDDEGQGSKVVEEPAVSNGIASGIIYVGPFDYDNDKWTWGEMGVSFDQNLFANMDYVKVTYKTSNDLYFLLPMKDMPDSYGPYGKRIDECSDWNTVLFDVTEFGQPSWSELYDPLDMSKVQDIAFITMLADGENVDIQVKEIVFYEHAQNPIDTDYEIDTKTNKIVINKITSDFVTITVPEYGEYSLFLYGVNGRLLSSICRKKLLPGIHQISYTGNSLPQGIYLLQVERGSERVAERILLIK